MLSLASTTIPVLKNTSDINVIIIVVSILAVVGTFAWFVHKVWGDKQC